MHITLSKQKIILYFILYYGFYLLLYQDFFAAIIVKYLGVSAYFVIDLFVYVLMSVCFLILGWRFYLQQIEHFKQNYQKCILHIIYGAIALFITNILLSQMICMFLPDAFADNQTNNELYMSKNLIGYLFSACIFAPFIEETIFRGCIFAKLREKHDFLISAVVSGSLFGFLHIIASMNAGNWTNCIFFILYAMCGIVLCISYEDTENFFASVLTHMLYNTIGIMVTLCLK